MFMLSNYKFMYQDLCILCKKLKQTNMKNIFSNILISWNWNLTLPSHEVSKFIFRWESHRLSVNFSRRRSHECLWDISGVRVLFSWQFSRPFDAWRPLTTAVDMLPRFLKPVVNVSQQGAKLLSERHGKVSLQWTIKL